MGAGMATDQSVTCGGRPGRVFILVRSPGKPYVLAAPGLAPRRVII
jgi:hypothetical protein